MKQPLGQIDSVPPALIATSMRFSPSVTTRTAASESLFVTLADQAGKAAMIVKTHALTKVFIAIQRRRAAPFGDPCIQATYPDRTSPLLPDIRLSDVGRIACKI
jgi:hypothetical protein